MTATPIRQPQDRQRPTIKPRQAAPVSREVQDEMMERGIAFTDDDGTRLVVRVKDIKGKHDAALVAAIGTDFVGLLERLSGRQGTDLFAALYWFGRLVNGRPAGEYADVLEEFSYQDVRDMDIDEPQEGEDAPKASASS